MHVSLTLILLNKKSKINSGKNYAAIEFYLSRMQEEILP